MVEFQAIAIGHFDEKEHESYSYNKDVEIDILEGKKLNADIPDISVPGRVNALSMILTLAGEANVEIDGKPYTLLPDTIIDITAIHVLRKFTFSDDYLGYNIMVSMYFYEDIFREGKHLTPEAAIKRKDNPIATIRPEDTALLVDSIKRIIWNIGRTGHIWHKRMIMNEVRSFFMETGNIIINNLAAAQNESIRPNSDLLFFKFMQLLQDNSNERKTAAFYADKLCLTTDYFAKLVKAYTNRNVTDWINESLLRQAKLYLQDSTISIQQVADMLNFSDQSAFGKFFKKQTGLSPGQYRRMQ